MLLAIDSGNTNTVFGLFDGDSLLGQWRMVTNAHRTADEYAVWLGEMLGLDNRTLKDIDGVVIATVVPQVIFNLRQLCERYCCCKPIIVTNEIDLGLRVLVDRPAEVGADRLVNAVAAYSTYKTALIVIDFGTATTFDCINMDGDYIGGVIAPGIDLSLEALHQAAAKLPLIAIERPKNVLGTTTVGAMQSGIYWGYISLIEGIVSRIRNEHDEVMITVGTGGHAQLFARATSVIENLDSELTLRGLQQIFQRNV